MEDKILKLTKLWYEYVNKDHHKDRDCHWHINKIWSYGYEPYYQVVHYGYVYESKNHKHYKSYEAAEKALYREIQKAFRKELKWAKDVIGDCDLYDNTQQARAEWLIKHYKED